MITTNFISSGKLTAAICAVTLLFLSLERGSSQGAVQITFDGSPTQPQGSQYAVNEYDESGMWFKPSGLGSVLLRNGGGEPFYPDDGTAYLQGESGIAFGFSDGQQFDLLSVDLAEFSTVWASPTTVDFIGYHPDGSTVTANFTTDGIIGSPGTLDFQAFAFQGFTDVVSVQVFSSLFSMDNLVVAVPEPASGNLILFGGLVSYAIWHRRKKMPKEAALKRN